MMTELTNWLYLSDFDHLDVREWVNGLWFAVSAAMCLEFGKSLIHRLRTYGFSCRGDVGTRAIIALFGYFLGETLMRGWVWLLLITQNSGSEWAGRVQSDYYIAFIAAGISTWAALCCLYVFSSNHWSWVRAVFLISIFVLFEVTIFSIR